MPEGDGNIGEECNCGEGSRGVLFAMFGVLFELRSFGDWRGAEGRLAVAKREIEARNLTRKITTTSNACHVSP